MSQNNQATCSEEMSAYGRGPSGIRFAMPTVAVTHYRWRRQFYMGKARESATRHEREDAVAAAKTANMCLIAALVQVRHG